MEMTIKAARVNAGLTQKEAASALGIGKTTLMSYEKYITFPNIITAQKIAKLYGVTVDRIKWAA